MYKIGLPEWVLNLAYKFVDVEKNSPTLDERVYEYAFVASKISKSPRGGTLLDIGCVARTNFIPTLACELGFYVFGLDIRKYWFKHPNFTFVKQDILTHNSLPSSFFDVVVMLSTLEHIGMEGRYGVKEGCAFGDGIAVLKVRKLLKEGGTFLLTLPYKQKGVKERYYDDRRIDWLCEGWEVKDKRIEHNLCMLELVK